MATFLHATLFRRQHVCIGSLVSSVTVQVRVIVERLARRCGFQAVSQHIPEKDRKLLAHIRKEKQRHERKRQGASEADGVRVSCLDWGIRPCCPKHACSPGSVPDLFVLVQSEFRAPGFTMSCFCGPL